MEEVTAAGGIKIGADGRAASGMIRPSSAIFSSGVMGAESYFLNLSVRRPIKFRPEFVSVALRPVPVRRF